MNNNDLSLIIIGLLLSINMILCWTLGALQVNGRQRDAELAMLRERKPGARRAGVIIPWPRTNYEDSEA